MRTIQSPNQQHWLSLVLPVKRIRVIRFYFLCPHLQTRNHNCYYHYYKNNGLSRNVFPYHIYSLVFITSRELQCLMNDSSFNASQSSYQVQHPFLLYKFLILFKIILSIFNSYIFQIRSSNAA